MSDFVNAWKLAGYCYGAIASWSGGLLWPVFAQPTTDSSAQGWPIGYIPAGLIGVAIILTAKINSWKKDIEFQAKRAELESKHAADMRRLEDKNARAKLARQIVKLKQSMREAGMKVPDEIDTDVDLFKGET